MKNKFPISENNIEKPLDKFSEMVYNGGNEKSSPHGSMTEESEYGNQEQKAHYPHGIL